MPVVVCLVYWVTPWLDRMLRFVYVISWVQDAGNVVPLDVLTSEVMEIKREAEVL